MSPHCLFAMHLAWMHDNFILKVCFGARFGLEGSKDPLRNRSFWTEDMMLFKEGRQFTFKPLKSMYKILSLWFPFLFYSKVSSAHRILRTGQIVVLERTYRCRLSPCALLAISWSNIRKFYALWHLEGHFFCYSLYQLEVSIRLNPLNTLLTYLAILIPNFSYLQPIV